MIHIGRAYLSHVPCCVRVAVKRFEIPCCRWSAYQGTSIQTYHRSHSYSNSILPRVRGDNDGQATRALRQSVRCNYVSRWQTNRLALPFIRRRTGASKLKAHKAHAPAHMDDVREVHLDYATRASFRSLDQAYRSGRLLDLRLGRFDRRLPRANSAASLKGTGIVAMPLADRFAWMSQYAKPTSETSGTSCQRRALCATEEYSATPQQCRKSTNSRQMKLVVSDSPSDSREES